MDDNGAGRTSVGIDGVALNVGDYMGDFWNKIVDFDIVLAILGSLILVIVGLYYAFFV